MTTYKLSENARNDVKRSSPAQIHYFVMSSKKADAIVLAAYRSSPRGPRILELDSWS